jgi:hypothetical protein
MSSSKEAATMEWSSTIRYAGTYRFADREILNRALAAARAHLDDDDDLVGLEGDWMRSFVANGTMLTVNLAVPALAEQRFAAAEIFLVLSLDAIEGNVQATIGGVRVDEFAPGDDE